MHRSVVLTLSVVLATFVLTAAPPLASAEDVRTEIGGSFIGVNTSEGDSCGWFIGVQFPHDDDAAHYEIEYWDGYWKRVEHSVATHENLAATDRWAGGGHVYSVTGGWYSPPCDLSPVGAGSDRFSQGAKVWAVRPLETTPKLKVVIDAPTEHVPPGARFTARVTLSSGDIALTSVRLNPLRASGGAVRILSVPKGLSGFDIASNSSRSFAFPARAIAKGEARLSTSALSGSAKGIARGAHRVTVTVGDPTYDVTGSAFALSCGDIECQRSPFSGARIVATPVGTSGKAGRATTSDAGSYHLELEEGRYRIEARSDSSDFDPTERVIDVRADMSVGDFETCAELLAPRAALTRRIVGRAAGTSSPCDPKFDYEMPDRVEQTIEPTNRPATAFRPTSYDVLLTVRRGKCDKTATYEWSIDGAPIPGLPTTGPCTWKWPAPSEGTYEVAVAQSATGKPTRTYTSKVVVQDFLIIAVGDSLASGEGERPFVDGPLVSRCHRSPRAYPVRAAKLLEQDDGTDSKRAAKRSSVTMVHIACTGAALSSLTNAAASQLRQAKALVGDRQVDAIVVSIGVNDLAFGDIVKMCVDFDPCPRTRVVPGRYLGLTMPGSPIPRLDAVVGFKASLLPSLYKQFFDEVYRAFPANQFNPYYTYVTNYPNPLNDDDGTMCKRLVSIRASAGRLGSITLYEFGGSEVPWARERVLVPLNTAIKAAVKGDNFFTFVPMPAAFSHHGYCAKNSWFVDLPSALTSANAAGIMHPNAHGHKVIADELVEVMQRDMYPKGEVRSGIDSTRSK